MGLDDGDELFARAKIGFHAYQLLEARRLPQREIAVLLGINLDIGILLQNLFESARPLIGMIARLAIQDGDLTLIVAVLRLEQSRGLFAA